MRQRAFTLVELLLVAAILAIAGLALIRGAASNDAERKLELAATEIASALRFARSEAMRTGAHHGVRLSSADHRIRVYRLDLSSSPPVEDYSVRHPFDKRLYDLDLDAASLTSGVEIDASEFRFGGNSTPYESVSFAATGTPVAASDLALMDSGVVTVHYGDPTQDIVLAPMTGRVTVP